MGKWEAANFVASNGVKQCGLLSPILYGINYYDLLLTVLKESDIGCYSDDVVLLYL